MKEWVETIENLRRLPVRYLHMDYSGVVMFLQTEWQYLMQTVPGVR